MTEITLLHQVKDLSPDEKAHFEELANSLHFQIHRCATVMGFKELIKNSIGKKTNEDAELFSANSTVMYKADPDYARSRLQCFYPLSEFETIKIIIKDSGTQAEIDNATLSRVSEEAAMRVIKRHFYNA